MRLKIILLDGVHKDHGLMKNIRNLHGPIFEDIFVTARQDRYDLMCACMRTKNKIIGQLMQQN